MVKCVYMNLQLIDLQASVYNPLVSISAVDSVVGFILGLILQPGTRRLLSCSRNTNYGYPVGGVS
jgi:hypothetical protein